MSRKQAGKIIFVTGTDTGVGKTMFTALLLHHLRESGCRALAMKPFCSGTRADVELLQSLQSGELSDEEANPYFYSRPVAPLIAQRRQRQKISLREVVRRIHDVKKKCDQLVIEGSGGLFVPLGERFMVADLIAELGGKVVVVARNRLGTVNHTLLTVEALKARRLREISVVLMDEWKPDYSAETNRKILQELLRLSVVKMPFLGRNTSQTAAVKNHCKKVKKTLAQILE